MNLKKVKNKNLNFIFKKNKDFSFCNDEENDENENPNKTLISNSSSTKLADMIIEFNKKQIKTKENKSNNIDLLNQLVANRLIQENRFLKQELEIAKSNILIFEEKEYQYKNIIEHLNIINKEKDVSYKNIVSLIDNYKKRESDLNNKLSIYSKELMKKNKIINQLNKKIDEIKDKLNKYNIILTEKTRIIDALSRKKKLFSNQKELDLKNSNSKNFTSKSLKMINHNRKESDVYLFSREKTLNNLNSKYYDFNIMDNNSFHKKNSYGRLNTLDNFKIYEKLSLNNINTNCISDNNNFTTNTEVSNPLVKFIRKNSGVKKIINKNNNFIKNNCHLQSFRKNNSYKNVDYNSVNSSINKNQSSINNSLNLVGFKKPLEKKIYKNLKLNSDKREIKNMTLLPSTNKNKSNKNNCINNYNNNFSLMLNDEENYLLNNNSNLKDFNKNKKGTKIVRKFLINKRYNITNETSIPNMKMSNNQKKFKKIELNKYINYNTDINSNFSLRNITTEKK